MADAASAMTAGSVSVEIGGNLAPLEAAFARGLQMARDFDAQMASALSAGGATVTLKSVSEAADGAAASMATVSAPATAAAAQIDKVAAAGVGATISAKTMAEALAATGGNLSKVTPEMLGLAAAEGEMASAARVATEATVALGAAETETATLSAGVSREFSVLGSEILRGNFSHIPGSLLVMNERLAASGAGVLTLKNLFGSLGSLASVVFNPMIIGFLAVSIGLDLLVRSVGSLLPKTESATDALKRHKDEIDQIIHGYSDAQKAADDYLAEAGKLPQGAVQSNLLQNAKELTDEANASLGYLRAEGSGLSASLNGLDQKIGKIVMDMVDGRTAASDLVTQLTELKNSDLGPLGFLLKMDLLDPLIQAAQKVSELRTDLIGFSFVQAGAATDQTTKFGLDQFVESKNSATAYKIDLDAINALSPAQQADIARRRKELELRGQNISTALAQQEVDQAGQLAYAQAQHDLSVKAQHEADTQKKAIDSVTQSLTDQLAALTQTDRERFISTQLSAAHVNAMSAEGKAIEQQAGQFYDLKQSIDAANQASNFLAQSLGDTLISIADGSTDAASALKNLVKSLEDAVLQAALLGQGPLAGILHTAPSQSGGIGGLLGSFVSGLLNGGGTGLSYAPSVTSDPWAGLGLAGHADGTANTGGTRGQPMGIVHGQEAVIPLPSGGKVPVQIMQPANSNAGGGNFTINMNFNGVTDMPSFQKSRAQIATAAARIVAQARRAS